MNISHHPDDATLVSYAAGSLSASFEILLACHLRQCGSCRRRVAIAEQLGSALLDETAPLSPGQRERFLARLEQQEKGDLSGRPSVRSAVSRCHLIPQPLALLLSGKDVPLKWRRLVPGIRQIPLDTADGQLRLIRIAPGVSIPRHSHQGSELTLVLQGAYRDALGYFSAGDVADLGPEVDHQPTTEGDQPCICLIATDAPLRFQGWLPKLLQPFTGF